MQHTLWVRGIRTAAPSPLISPPHRTHLRVWGREAGPRSREGRSLCGQSGQSHPEGWVLRQHRRKTHLLSLLRTRWNVIVWSAKGPGRGYPSGKDQRKRFKERRKPKSSPPRRLDYVDELVLAVSAAAASPTVRMSSNTGKLWIYFRVFWSRWRRSR